MAIRTWVLAVCLAATPPAFGGERVQLPEGTQVRLRMLDSLSSADAVVGERFNLELEADLVILGKVIVARGAKAVGVVTAARPKGLMGKGGELEVVLESLAVGEQRVPLRSAGAHYGNDKGGTAVTLTVLFGPLGLLKRGHDVQLGPGTMLEAWVDRATEVEVP